MEADAALMIRLSVEGSRARPWRRVAEALVEYGFTVMRSWVVTGHVFVKLREKGRPLDAPTAGIPRDDALELAEDTVAEAIALTERGLQVWYDEFELRIGDSLRRKIDAGIARSRFGIVVLSSAFFAKGWPKYELDALVTMAVSGRQVLLPLWHRVSKDEVVSYSPSLADKVALRTADNTIEEIADEIAAVVRPE